MPVTIVVGAQWGDEGKGRIIDLLAEEADIIVRFQGGCNAGHTLFDSKGQKIILHQIPSGILRDEKVCVIGNGVVLDPVKLLEEIKELQSHGYLKKTSQLMIADGCHLVMPHHKMLDQLEEAARGNNKIGTTGKGIGPAYADKVARSGIRLCDLMDREQFRRRLEEIVPQKTKLLKNLYQANGLDIDEIMAEYEPAAKTLAPYVANVPLQLNLALKRGAKIMGEGAQGSELDVDHGTYPYVTSSNTLAAAALLGAGIPPQAVTRVIGIVKAYTTRVGSGPFPTEENGPLGEELCQKGNEFGSTTGRKRRCGWLDIPQLKHAIMLNGISSVILTKLDILNGFKVVPVCTAYRYRGSLLKEMPTGSHILSKVEPVYEELPGWQIEASEIRSFKNLPKAARGYIEQLEQWLQCPIELASIGPKRDNFFSHTKKSFAAFSASPVLIT